MSSEGPPSQEVLESLAGCLTPARLSVYLGATDGNLSAALDLYNWNTNVAAAFYLPLQWLEITLRNSIDNCLIRAYGHDWHSEEAIPLSFRNRRQIQRAMSRVEKHDRAISHPRVVAELSFGFWVSLLGKGGNVSPKGPKVDYEMALWRPTLRKAFPNRAILTKKQAFAPLRHLWLFRNRIAHHEPIFRRHLSRDHSQIIEVTDWISPEARAWIEQHSRVPELLDDPIRVRLKS